ncbi:MAG: bacteriohemerythrin [Gammaproteobacteria bacterium]|nr:bacteriohemerythrin [Gammaproteobacteria bacterium]
MPLMHWSPNLSVGIDFIDSEHQQLMAGINQLHELLNAGQHERLADALDDLLHKTREHFEHEENTMRDNGYRHLKHHKGLHDALLEELEEFRDRTASNDMHAGTELSDFLKDWLLEHILESDKHLGGFLEGVASKS